MNFREIIIKSCSEQKTIRIKYYSKTTDHLVKERDVDVYEYDSSLFRGFCHLRREIRTFNFDRVLEASITDKNFTASAYLISGQVSQIDHPFSHLSNKRRWYDKLKRRKSDYISSYYNSPTTPPPSQNFLETNYSSHKFTTDFFDILKTIFWIGVWIGLIVLASKC